MKKQKMKLGLNKISVSNLRLIRGGDGPETRSCTCPVIDTTGNTDECPETWETTCYSGHPGCPTFVFPYTYKC